MSNRGWTPERRPKQAAAIQRWKPWTRSTGPRTDDGKAASSMNSLRHGERPEERIEAWGELRALLRELREEERAERMRVR